MQTCNAHVVWRAFDHAPYVVMYIMCKPLRLAAAHWLLGAVIVMYRPSHRKSRYFHYLADVITCRCQSDEWLPGLNDSQIIDPEGWSDFPGGTVTPHRTTAYLKLILMSCDQLWIAAGCPTRLVATCQGHIKRRQR